MIEYENLKGVNESFFNEYQIFFEEFLKSGWYVLGKSVTNFEKEFAKYCGTDFCTGVASGLDALILAINAFDFPADSEIIVPSNTYIATILAVVRNGLKPVLVEPDIRSYNLDVTKIEEKITKKTRAILAVHLYGKACDMTKICHIASKYDLQIIEDCAQAHGAKHKEQQVGSFGIGCFSFYPTKNLGALGDAGAVLTNEEAFSKRIESLRNYGSSIKYHNKEVGYNSRLDEIQAGFLSIKLKYLDKITQHKRNLGNLYLENLDKQFILPQVDEEYYDVYHIFNIRHEKRDQLREFLLHENIKTAIHYPIAPHKQDAMRGIISGEFPVSEEIHRTTLSLPISYFHTKNDVFQVIDKMNKWLKLEA